MKIAEFFAEIGFKVDTKSLQQFNNSLSSVVNTVKGLGLTLAGTMTAWQALQTRIGKNAQTMLNFKTYTGESIEEVRKMAAVMQGININFSMDTLLEDVARVKTQLRELQVMGEGSGLAQALRMVGMSGLQTGSLSTIQDFLKMLRAVPDPATRTMLVERMGISKQFLNLLELTDDQYQKLEQLAPKIFPDEKELKRRQQASLDIYLVWLELRNLFETKITDFAPILEKILNKIIDIVEDSDKLKTIVEGIKWTVILSALLQAAVILGTIVSHVRALAFLLGIIGGYKLGEAINEKLGIAQDSVKGRAIKTATTAGTAVAATTAAVAAPIVAKKATKSIAKKIGSSTAATAVGYAFYEGVDRVKKVVTGRGAQRAARNATGAAKTVAQMTGVGLSAFRKGAQQTAKTATQQATKATAQQAAKTTAQQTTKSTAQQAAKTTAQQTTKSTAQQAAKTTAKIAGSQVAKTTAQQATKAATQQAVKQVAKTTAAKAGARTVAGSLVSGPMAPVVGTGLALWGAYDISKAIYDVVRANQKTDTTVDTTPIGTPSSPLTEQQERQQYDWSSTLSNLTINAQNVYLRANNVITTGADSIDFSQQQINTMMTNFSNASNW